MRTPTIDSAVPPSPGFALTSWNIVQVHGVVNTVFNDMEQKRLGVFMDELDQLRLLLPERKKDIMKMPPTRATMVVAIMAGCSGS